MRCGGDCGPGERRVGCGGSWVVVAFTLALVWAVWVGGGVAGGRVGINGNCYLKRSVVAGYASSSAQDP